MAIDPSGPHHRVCAGDVDVFSGCLLDSFTVLYHHMFVCALLSLFLCLYLDSHHTTADPGGLFDSHFWSQGGHSSRIS